MSYPNADMRGDLPERAASALLRIRTERPLVHHLTNFVTANDSANVTLSLGALPVMAHAPEEVGEMAAQASALVLNLGTLTEERLQAMCLAGRAARVAGIPIVMDPVGVGSTEFRRTAAYRLLAEAAPHIVRGNLAELKALSGQSAHIRGVDSFEAMEQASTQSEGEGGAPSDGVEGDREGDRGRLAHWAAQKQVCAAITGAVDFLTDGRRSLDIRCGHPLFQKITGAGCMASSVIGCFAAVEPDPFVAAAGGLLVLGIAGEIAAAEAAGPGSFRVALLDALFRLETDVVRRRGREALVPWTAEGDGWVAG